MIYQMRDVRIRPIGIDDVQKHFSWFQTPEVTRWTSHGRYPYDARPVVEYIEKAREITDRVIWAVDVFRRIGHSPGKEETTHVGVVSLQRIDYVAHSAELAIIIGDRTVWGGGVGKAAAYMAVSHGFTKLGMNRIWTGTPEMNGAMDVVAEFIGMEAEGRMREAVCMNARFVDVIMYSILRREFLEHREKIEAELAEKLKGA